MTFKFQLLTPHFPHFYGAHFQIGSRTLYKMFRWSLDCDTEELQCNNRSYLKLRDKSWYLHPLGNFASLQFVGQQSWWRSSWLDIYQYFVEVSVVASYGEVLFRCLNQVISAKLEWASSFFCWPCVSSFVCVSGGFWRWERGAFNKISFFFWVNKGSSGFFWSCVLVIKWVWSKSYFTQAW